MKLEQRVMFTCRRGSHVHRFHVNGTRFHFAGWTFGHAFVRAHIDVGRVLDHERAILENLVFRVVIGADFVARRGVSRTKNIKIQITY